MGSVSEYFRRIVKSTKVLVAKVGAFILLVFFLGMIAGGLIFAWDYSLLWYPAFFLSIVIMWNDFGEGVVIFLLLLLLFLFAPWVFPSILI
ncbi:MAG: hypothetical protein V1776_01430 [Candidatus Diapherotrites archaeon]